MKNMNTIIAEAMGILKAVLDRDPQVKMVVYDMIEANLRGWDEWDDYRLTDDFPTKGVEVENVIMLLSEEYGAGFVFNALVNLAAFDEVGDEVIPPASYFTEEYLGKTE